MKQYERAALREAHSPTTIVGWGENGAELTCEVCSWDEYYVKPPCDVIRVLDELDRVVESVAVALSGLPARLDHEGRHGMSNEVSAAIAMLTDEAS